MSKRRFHYGPGDWIAVPLVGGWAVGLIARMHPLGTCLGYFFRPLLKELPKLEHLRHLRPEHAIFVGQFLSAALEDGEWPVLGRFPDWDPCQWPVPKFRFYHPVANKWIIREYDESLNYGPERWGATEEEVRDLSDDGTSYGGALQIDLARLLGTKAPVDPDAAVMRAANEPPRHFIYFHDKELAQRAADACRELGYDPVFEESADEQRPWLLLVRHKTPAATEDEMEKAGERLAEVAAEWGGYYDGWDRPA